MWAYIQRRLITMVPVLLGVSLVVFLMLHFLPGDPVMMMLTEHRGASAPTVVSSVGADQYESMRKQLGLDQPLPVQFGSFLWGVVRGDLGKSFRSGEQVSDLIARNLPFTIQLAVVSLGVAVLIGFALGVTAAIHRGTWLDMTAMTLAVVGVSMPSFWLGIMLLLIFALQLGILPAVGMATGWDSLILPSVALGFSAAAIIARLVRSSLVDVLVRDYVRTARAKGLQERMVILRHALKNALIPVVTVLGLQFGTLLGGAVVVETVFARPGIGQLVVKAILEKDFPIVQGVVLFTATAYVVANFLVDVSYSWLDPRIRYGDVRS
jgi:ABC-type dipeptide/oligopeptide/nickel transport system permease component